jgi:general secretion pathway protein L
MKPWRQIAEVCSACIDGAAASVVAIVDVLAAAPTVRLVEDAEGSFTLEAPRKRSSSPALRVSLADGTAVCSPGAAPLIKGKRVELALQPRRFFFRPLELPRRAADFIQGVIQAQIDRITPWTANDAVFGWGAPSEVSDDRISVTVAAAARAQIMPVVQAIGAIGGKSITVTTTLPDAGQVSVFDQLASGGARRLRARRALAVGLVAMALLAALAVGGDLYFGKQLRARQAEIAQRIAAERGLIRAGADAVANSALAQLERRKNDTAASVIVLEALSKVLPDHTYVTELRIEGNKVQIVGITNDAPSLIRLIEESPHFSRATFFAPTTRAPSDPGDRFHIEAQIKPVFSPPS